MAVAVRLEVLLPGGTALPRLPGARVVVHRASDLAEASGRVMAGAADALLLSPRAAGVDADAVAALRRTGCRVIGLREDAVGQPRLGIDEWLAAPVAGPALIALLGSAGGAQAPQPGSGAGAVVAVWGPPGAPGRTTVAQLVAMAARAAGRRCLVIDLDLAAPMPAPDVPGAQGALLRALRRAALGGPGLDDLVVPVAPGLSLLPGLHQPQRWGEVGAAGAAALLDAAAQGWDLVVVDCGADLRAPGGGMDAEWAPWPAAAARGVLRQADVVVAVAHCDHPGVARLDAWWPVLLEAAGAPGLLVANRHRPDREPLASTMAARYGVPVHMVPEEPAAAVGLRSPTLWRAGALVPAAEALWRRCDPARRRRGGSA